DPGLPFLILQILLSQKMAKTETHDTYPRIRILKLRYSYKVLLLIWKYCLSLYALVKTLSFLPVVPSYSKLPCVLSTRSMLKPKEFVC
uniref:Uncharacterized protein n=1 Tax=Accipiter nisus TaxID=211598 RepID=A0A8B9MIQ3_9AVES